MNYSEYLPYAVAFIIAVPFLIYLRQFVFTYVKFKEKELQLLAVKGGSENRLQAYERMTLFLERIKPGNLTKEFDSGLKPHEFVYLLEKKIAQEFDYNASLQLYISKNTWQDIVTSKNNIMLLAHQSYEGLQQDVSLEDFKTVFLMNYMQGDDFIGQTQDQLKKEGLTLGN